MDLRHAAKVLVKGTPALLTGGKPGARAGDNRLAWSNPKLDAPATLEISAEAFSDNGPIPTQHTADGGGVSPALRWSHAPAGTQSWALIVEDPDAPLPKPFVHWLVYNLPAGTTSLPPSLSPEKQLDAPQIMQGKNSSLKIGYAGCAPPKGDDAHRYFFQLFALDRMLQVDPGAGRSELLTAMENHVIARGKLVGTYQR